MPNKIEAVITIAKIGEKENKFWIKDQNGEFYSGFKEYQGTQNNEYAQLILGNHGEPFQEGQQALITFTKTAGTDKTGKDVIYKNLKGIYPAEPTKTAHQPQSPRIEANRGQSDASGVVPVQRGASDDQYWDKKAYKQCLWGFWLNKTNNTPSNTADWKNLVWDIFKEIETDAEKRFNPSPVRNAVERTAPGFFKKPERVWGDPSGDGAQDAASEAYDDPTDGEINPMVNDEPPLEDGPGFGDEDWKFER